MEIKFLTPTQSAFRPDASFASKVVFDQRETLLAFVDQGTGSEDSSFETGMGDHRSRQMVVGGWKTRSVIE